MNQLLNKLLKLRFGWVIKQVWGFSLLTVTGIFLFLGMTAYQKDVAIIETEMVQTARWVDANTPSDSLIAAHDIGALGYFSNRKIIDLAGLINPQVIPFIRDEDQLGKYMDDHNVNYLVTFPDWYPNLVREGKIIYSTQAKISPAEGGENMTIYIWEKENY